MPPALPWSELAIGLKEEDADLLLETFKAFKISKSDQAQCTVCNDPSPHNMRKRILLCACHQYQLAMPYARCLWRGKRLQCGRHNVVDVFQTGTYVTARRQPRPPRLTRAMKDFAKEMADQGLKPARIRSGLLHKFELCTSSLPSLKVVQRFVNNYKSTQLGGNDYLDDLRNMLMACCVNESTSSKAFAVETTPTVTLVHRASEMRRAGLLFEDTKERGTFEVLLNDAPADDVGAASAEVVNVVSRRVARIYDPETKRSRKDLAVTAQLGQHTARMEVAGIPATGWPVNTRQWSCPCVYWAKYGACVHTLLAKHVRGVHVMNSREKLEYRGPNRRKSGCQQAGRPSSNTPALVIEKILF
ncbi:Dolichol-phosphate mannosyltransferase [Phytophthora nicotianae]|uniref:Dolichol-phosphate mannosyltransferase n=1 Tax=Phytophthora nicotianae TaxID=4792 RepID=A0A0W8DD06_PHYNI|nr:Dolichol-phosphate mannosyltransferase [Phytophthora nicotianae]